VNVPKNQPSGPLYLKAEFDAGPLAGVLRATRTVDVKQK
jgi:hypothetical protein